jgi:hypothetical protein
MKTGLESLDTGAPEITYSGNEGPKSPQQMQQMQQMQMAQLEEEYDAYVDDMIEQGIEPMSMRQFLEQIAAEAQMSSNEEGIGSMMEDSRAMAADGGVMQLVKKNKDGSRSGYRGPGGYQGGASSRGGPPGGGATAGGSGRDFSGGGGRDTGPSQGPAGGASAGGNYGGNVNVKQEYGGKAYEDQSYATQESIDNAKKQKAKEKAAAEKEAKEKEEKEKEQTRNFFQKFVDKRKKAYLQGIEKKMYEDDMSLEDYEEEDFAKGFGGNYGKIQGAIKSAEEGTLTQSEFEKFMPGGIYSDKPAPVIPLGGGGGGGGQQTQPATPPATPPPGGGLPDIPTDFVDLSGTQSYTNPAFAGQYFYGTPTITLANGGRANYAGGGIANLRQGYFLGKLVKSITKPFKKAFRGFKKIAKSPMGKMALLALGGYYLGGGTGLGGARMFPGNTGFSMQNLPGASFFSKKPVLSPNAIGGDKVIPKLMSSNNLKPALDSGNFLTKSLGFMKDNPLATIYGTSLFSGLYTDYMNNKRKDETMADYQRRLEEERGNFAPIPVDPVQFAANGGRIGFADGGDDEDEDESIRSKALGALYQKLAMGGSAGLPPVTMQTEGQDTQSFGDDESTGMPQATPTMQNQMPMRQPMMDPRIQNQMMMAQRGNPMMNRGMMSMQQPPRIMAQEGGMMDMGGMEKDYRNEGGFVPIGEYERKDDVPARLSKNEFVFTADAVRNAGGGDIDRGAEIMENMMENLEAGGKISEASQGLKGAREMFATQQRLGEVL